MIRVGFSLMIWAAAMLAAPLPDAALKNMRAADVVVLGEVHDNPLHHSRQEQAIKALLPAALVFEMLSPAEAARATDALRADWAGLEAALDWQSSGWPDFAMYYPLFTAAPLARIFGAELGRQQAQAALSQGVVESFGPEAGHYGLTEPLPPAQQEAREALQFEAHCGALPREMLAGMVELQRLRDATLARAVVQAIAETGGPVVVITGNGHARRDWGAPSFLARIDPQLVVYALGQGESGAEPDGGFDLILDAPAVARPDPCEAFR